MDNLTFIFGAIGVTIIVVGIPLSLGTLGFVLHLEIKEAIQEWKASKNASR